jgi:acyl carrier protein
MPQTQSDPVDALVREVVVKLASAPLEPQDIKGEMSLKQDLGISSLQFIRLIIEIESKLARPIFNVQLIAQIRTFHDLCAAVNPE